MDFYSEFSYQLFAQIFKEIAYIFRINGIYIFLFLNYLAPRSFETSQINKFRCLSIRTKQITF